MLTPQTHEKERAQMEKTTLGPQTYLYPKPAFLIGASVNGKPNFMTAACCGLASTNPPMVSVGLRPGSHTYKGVKENRVFSLNVPSRGLVKETDHCGIVSGATEDKTVSCRFTVFYGQLKDVPLIKECPLNLECSVLHELSLGSHILLIGRIEETHVSEDCLTDGKPDVCKIEPIVYCGGAEKAYHAIGDMLAQAFSIGMEIGK